MARNSGASVGIPNMACSSHIPSRLTVTSPFTPDMSTDTIVPQRGGPRIRKPLAAAPHHQGGRRVPCGFARRVTSSHHPGSADAVVGDRGVASHGADLAAVVLQSLVDH